MTAKVLQLVNSAFFGRSRAISNPTEAASYLGLVRIQQLCLTVYAFRQFEPQNCPYFSIERLWSHSVATAVLGKRLAESSMETRKFADDVYTAGLLHDIGKLVLVSRIPEDYSNAVNWAREHEVPGWQAEQELLHATHAEVGAYLLGLWGLPDAIVEAVAYHHRPGAHQGNSFCPLTIVHVADVLEHERCTIVGPDVPPKLDNDYLTRINLQDQVTEWREAGDSMAADDAS
jgi:putative nucleotidyltransferase with HDIG domain